MRARNYNLPNHKVRQRSFPSPHATPAYLSTPVLSKTNTNRWMSHEAARKDLHSCSRSDLPCWQLGELAILSLFALTSSLTALNALPRVRRQSALAHEQGVDNAWGTWTVVKRSEKRGEETNPARILDSTCETDARDIF